MTGCEDVASFMAVTGTTDEATASTWLEMANGKLDAAVEMFLQMHGGGSSNGAHYAAVGGVSDPYGGGMGGSSNGTSPGTKRALEGDPSDPDYVRPADEVKRQRLIDTPSGSYGYGAYGGGGGGGSSYHNTRGTAAAAAGGAFAASPSEPFRYNPSAHSASEGGVEGAAQRRKQHQPLAELYAAPVDLMFGGSFQEAREFGKVEKKWLLVNIQGREEFASHRLNRDTWKDETVAEVVRSMCIFWQHDKDDMDGRTYCTRYEVASVPHLALVDPRTGRKEWERTGFVSPESLVEQLMDFASSHSLEKNAPSRPVPNPHASHRPGGSGSNSGSSGGGGSANKPLSEEEELAKAVAESLKEAEALKQNDSGSGGSSTTSSNSDSSSSDDVVIVSGPKVGGTTSSLLNNNKSVGHHDVERSGSSDSDVAVVCVKPAPDGASNSNVRIGKENGVSAATEKTVGKVATAPVAEGLPAAEASTAAAAASSWCNWFMDVPVPEEPAADDAQSCRVKFRLANNKSCMRRFKRTDVVAGLYRYAVAAVSEAPAEGAPSSLPALAESDVPRRFDLRCHYPPVSLRDSAQQTLEEAKLANECVTMLWAAE